MGVKVQPISTNKTPRLLPRIKVIPNGLQKIKELQQHIPSLQNIPFQFGYFPTQHNGKKLFNNQKLTQNGIEYLENVWDLKRKYIKLVKENTNQGSFLALIFTDKWSFTHPVIFAKTELELPTNYISNKNLHNQKTQKILNMQIQKTM